MAEENTELIVKSAQPTSIQHAPPYITRQPLYITNPTIFTAQQWRLTAREPITKLCIRTIVREIIALEWDITSENPEQDEAQIKNLKSVFANADEGDGLDAWLSRMLQDALTLPIAGNSEAVPDDITGMIGGLYHIDGATIYPTYDPTVPFVQINPYNGLDRVYFGRDDILRLVLHPHVELVKKMYQEAPVESAFTAIESLSRIYIYYLKQLGDTPMAGILDLMDMSEKEASEWAVGFREMFEGIDPFKIPILYDHTKPAKFISFGRSPQDLNIVEVFKRYAELVAAAFGLSIGDLRLFEHERVLAGVEASQRVTARSGIGFYAQAVEDMINSKLLKTDQSGFKFQFIMGMTGVEQAEATLAQTRAQILMTMTGNQPILKPADALKQAEQWEIIDVETTGVPTAPGLEGLGMPSDNVESIDENANAINDLQDQETQPEALDTIDQAAGDMEQFKSLLSGGHIVNIINKSKVPDRFIKLMTESFKQVGKRVNGDIINEVIMAAESNLPEDYSLKSFVEKAKTAAEVLDDVLADQDWYLMPDIVDQLLEILKQGYEEGSLEAIDKIQKMGYTNGFTDSPVAPEVEFVLRNQRVIDLISDHGAVLVQQVDDGTKYYLRQKILDGLEVGASPSDIANEIANNLFVLKPGEAQKLGKTRIMSIVNTELNWANSRANFDQMVASDLKTKIWTTSGHDVCDICIGNEALGPVEMDYEYATVFGDQTTLHPPAHPNTCRCNLDADANELKGFFDSGVGYWTGYDDEELKEIVERETQKLIGEAKQQKHLPGMHDQESHGHGSLSDQAGELIDGAPSWITRDAKAPYSVAVIALHDPEYKKLLGDKFVSFFMQNQYNDEGEWQWEVRTSDQLRNLKLRYVSSGKEKSLPMQTWGQPDVTGKRSRFESVGDAQHYLSQFSLVPVISDSMIDVDGGNYAYAGVIWGKDGDPYVEAALLEHNQIPVEDIKSGKAKVFGAKGIRTKNVVKSEADKAHTSAMLALDVDPTISSVLGVVGTPHVTLMVWNKDPSVEFDVEKASKVIETWCQRQVENTLTLRLAGNIMSLGLSCECAGVKLTPQLKRLRDQLAAEFSSIGLVPDKTYADFIPHVTMSCSGNNNQLGSLPAEATQSWTVDGIWLFQGDDKRSFFKFGSTSKSLFGDYVDKVPARYKQEFANFARVRFGVMTDGNLESEVNEHPVEIERIYNDFIQTLFVGGFDYYNPGEGYPPLVRSITFENGRYVAGDDAPAMVKSFLSGPSADPTALLTWFVNKGYHIGPLDTGDDEMNKQQFDAMMKQMSETQAAVQKSNQDFLMTLLSVMKSQSGQVAQSPVNIHLPNHLELEVPPQAPMPTPIINITMPEMTQQPIHVDPAQVTVNVPKADPAQVTVNVPPAQVTVNVPEQKTPSVIVNVPEMQAPDITVNVPESKPQIVVAPVSQGEQNTELEVVRGVDGKIKSVVKKTK